MHANHKPRDSDCPGCRGCLVPDHSSDEGQDRALPSGWRLGIVSIGLFLGPCILAIVGAACFGKSHAAQLSGAVTGLLAGMIGSVAVARLSSPKSPRRVAGVERSEPPVRCGSGGSLRSTPGTPTSQDKA